MVIYKCDECGYILKVQKKFISNAYCPIDEKPLRLKTSKKEQQIQIFGETIESMLAMKHEFFPNNWYAMIILSNAQEQMARGNLETARKYINKAKYFISEEYKKTAKCKVVTNYAIKTLSNKEDQIKRRKQ